MTGQKQKEMNLDQDVQALLFFDVFKKQITPAVTDLSHNYNCIVTQVPNNDTIFFFNRLIYLLTDVQDVSLEISFRTGTFMKY